MRLFQRFFIICILLIGVTFTANQAHAQDAQLQNVQEFLTEHGYAPGKADGFMGPRTKAAIESFQKDNSLSITGEIDAATLNAVQKMRTPPVKPVTNPAAPSNDAGSTSAIVWVILGALITFLLTKMFGGKSKKPKKQILLIYRATRARVCNQLAERSPRKIRHLIKGHAIMSAIEMMPRYKKLKLVELRSIHLITDRLYKNMNYRKTTMA